MAHDILIVDDEADIRMLIAGVLKDEGYATREAADTTQTLAAIQARQPTLVILDIWLQGGGLEGIEILKQLRVEMPSVPVVMISGHGTIETAVEAIKLGAYDFLEKPFKSDRLLLVVERAIEAAQLRRENEELRLRAGGDLDLVGISPAANQLRQQIERVAPTGSRVLITGPPGSGKEVVGRLLHARSRRSKGPFVPVNCATMRPERLEMELFGTETRIDGAPRKVGTAHPARVRRGCEGGVASVHMAGQCEAAAQRHRLAVDHGPGRRARAAARRYAPERNHCDRSNRREMGQGERNHDLALARRER